MERRGVSPPFRRRSPKLFSPKVYPPCGPVFTSASAHYKPWFTYSDFLIRYTRHQSQPPITITSKFISQPQNHVCLFSFIHTEPFPHSFRNSKLNLAHRSRSHLNLFFLCFSFPNRTKPCVCFLSFTGNLHSLIPSLI
jgi:hypothetical protein